MPCHPMAGSFCGQGRYVNWHENLHIEIIFLNISYIGTMVHRNQKYSTFRYGIKINKHMKLCNKATDFFKCSHFSKTHTCRGERTIEQPNNKKVNMYLSCVQKKERKRKRRKEKGRSKSESWASQSLCKHKWNCTRQKEYIRCACLMCIINQNDII